MKTEVFVHRLLLGLTVSVMVGCGGGGGGSSPDVNNTADNNAPDATAQSVTVGEDSVNNTITLGGSDSDGDVLTYMLVTQPSHGTLGGTAPNLFYTPQKDYFGSDSFTFKVSDGTDESAVATVSISVTSINDAPSATAKSITVGEDSSGNAITLSGSDIEGDTLTYALVTQPSHGTLGGTAPNLLYTPQKDYFGSDSFTFKVSDGTDESSAATVSISVTGVNDAPSAAAKSVTVGEDSVNNAITLSGSDSDSDTLTYTLMTQPSHGTLGGTAPALTYTPVANYHGSDSFTYTVHDGTVASAAAKVSITVTSVNDIPVADAGDDRNCSPLFDPILTLAGAGSDIEGDTISYAWSFAVQPGGSAPDISDPNVADPTVTLDTVGSYEMELVVSDGTAESEAKRMTITALGLRQTGQSSSYDTNGTEITDGTLKDDGYYRAGETPNFTRNTTAMIVTDHLTNLQWADDSNASSVTKPWVTQENYDLGNYTDTSGDTAATYCSGLTLGGYTDWRVPTIEELVSILDRSRNNPAITAPFVNVAPVSYWSVTPSAWGALYAWVIDFGYGNDSTINKNFALNVRCVRSGQ